ncbi:MAG: response regulator transcription factor [Planctomycetota bacterium]
MAKILIVEDDQRCSDGISARLRSEGYEILRAEDPITGIRMAAAHDPHLVMLEVDLASLGSTQMIEMAREHKSTADIPFILLSSEEFAGLDQMAADYGACSFLRTPYQPDELLETVEAALTLDRDNSLELLFAEGWWESIKEQI